MPYIPFLTYALILINVYISWKGLTSNAFFEKYSYRVDQILVNKEYVRLISSAFLHISWSHLIFNMLTLYLFGEMLEAGIGSVQFGIVYLAGLMGGKLLSLFIHRQHADYGSVGASGAICGIIFASLALFPGMSVRFIGIPIDIAGWFYGLGYLIYTIYGIRSKTDNIGHESHLGGALIGMLVALAMHPAALLDNYTTIAIITFPVIIFMYIILTRPYVLFVENLYFTTHLHNATIDDRYNLAKTQKKKEIDRILDKINVKGINSLSKEEKYILDEYSNSL